ncbi:MAG: acetyl-CoA hydrolase/transferase family protein [Caulobacterales bacterium]
MLRRIAKSGATRISPSAAAALVQSGMWLDYTASFSQPDVFDAALAARAAELTGVKIRNCFTLKPRAFLEADPERRHFENYNWHFSGYDRGKSDAGVCHYIPLNLGEVPDYYRRFIDPVDIVIVKTLPMDEDGWFNFGPTNIWHRAIIERARMVIVEVSRGLPYVFPQENGVHVSEVDYVIDGDDGPPPEVPKAPSAEIDNAVARLIAQEVEDGATLQIGIGALPNAVCSLLKESGVKDIGVHTELLTEGIVELYQAGCVTGAKKKLDPGKVAFTFAVGSKDLYAAVDRNPDMLCLPVDYTNIPHVIMQNDNVVSINSTTQIDLQGQAASESDGHRHISGTGGQLQFVRGAYASRGGKSFICLPSTYERKGVRKSRIVLDLTLGNIVTTPRSDVMYVVTEYGIANLKGRSVCERARALIGLAHPDFREELERAAHEHGLIPRGLLVSGASAHG